MSFHDTLEKFGIEQTINYLYKDPEKNLRTIMDWADKFSGGEFPTQRQMIREAIEEPNHPYHSYILHMIRDIDPEVMKTLVTNFFINANLVGWPLQEKLRKEYDGNIPWAVLLDHGRRERRPLHRSRIPGERGAPLRQVRPVRRPLETGGRPAAG